MWREQGQTILKAVFHRVVRSYCYSCWWLGTHRRLRTWWSRLPSVWSKCRYWMDGEKSQKQGAGRTRRGSDYEVCTVQCSQARRNILGDIVLPKYMLSLQRQYMVHFKRCKVGAFVSLCFIRSWLSCTNLIVYEHTLPKEYIMNNEMIPEKKQPLWFYYIFNF